TPLFAGALVATYISVEAPISGMSMNPARSLASAIPAGAWGPLWIYFVAPPARDAAGRARLRETLGSRGGLLREAPPPQLEAVHLPLPLRRADLAAAGTGGAGTRALAARHVKGDCS